MSRLMSLNGAILFTTLFFIASCGEKTTETQIEASEPQVESPTPAPPADPTPLADSTPPTISAPSVDSAPATDQTPPTVQAQPADSTPPTDHASHDHAANDKPESPVKEATKGKGTKEITPTQPVIPAKISLEFAELDMGYISLDALTTREVKVYNRSETPLNITKVKSSCGCTKGAMIETLIPAGGEGILNVTIDPNKMGGFKVTKVLTLSTDHPETPTLRLPVTSRIKGEVIFSERFFDFRVLKENIVAEKKIRMTQTQPEAVTVQEINYPKDFPEAITYKVEEVPADEWKDKTIPEHYLVAKISKGLQPGTHKYNVNVKLNHKRYEKHTVPISVTIEGPYTFQPSAITLRKAVPGTPQEGVMTLSFTKPTEVIEISVDNELIEITHKPGTVPNTILFDLLITKPHENRLQKAVLSIKMKVDGKEITHKINVIALLVQSEPTPPQSEPTPKK